MAESKPLTFEESLAELEKIVSRLERGDVALEELVAQFEKGSTLADNCRAKLAALQTKIEVLAQNKNAVVQTADANEEAVPDAPRKSTRKIKTADADNLDIPF